MAATNVTPLHDRQRNPRDFSLTPQEERRREAMLRAAWMKIVDGFDCRPTPRSAWDHAADGSEARWNKLLEPMRMAMVSAVFNGNPDLIDQTLEGVREFLRAMEADVASLVPPREEESVVALAICEAQASSEAKVETLRLVAHPSPAEAERAIEPLAREESTLVRLIDRCQRFARQSEMRAMR